MFRRSPLLLIGFVSAVQAAYVHSLFTRIEPDAPSTLYRPFNEVKAETNIFRNHPDLPQPY